MSPPRSCRVLVPLSGTCIENIHPHTHTHTHTHTHRTQCMFVAGTGFAFRYMYREHTHTHTHTHRTHCMFVGSLLLGIVACCVCGVCAYLGCGGGGDARGVGLVPLSGTCRKITYIKYILCASDTKVFPPHRLEYVLLLECVLLGEQGRNS